ncbi:response regulator transcription factor [Roseiarcus fermentans]|nr:response regulator transcription factor [Roseiarcus fermentans]
MGLGTLSGYVCFAYGDVEEFANDDKRANCEIVIMACLGVDGEALAMALARLRDFEPTLPVLVLGPPKVEYISIAIAHGAKGYIPFTTRFEVMVEVIRVILAGGTYAPLDCLAAAGPAAGRDAQADGVRIASSPAALTARELSVVRAIQQGKSNKVIAYNLNMTESTVKVHVRHIMTKLKAKNRTEIAVMSDKIGLELCDELPLN